METRDKRIETLYSLYARKMCIIPVCAKRALAVFEIKGE